MENNKIALYFVTYLYTDQYFLGKLLPKKKIVGKIARGEVLNLRATQGNILHYIHYIMNGIDLYIISWKKTLINDNRKTCLIEIALYSS